jgi:hypothetical protein
LSFFCANVIDDFCYCSCCCCCRWNYSWRGTSLRKRHDATPWFFLEWSFLYLLLEVSYTSNTTQNSSTRLLMRSRRTNARGMKPTVQLSVPSITFTNLMASSGGLLARSVTTIKTNRRRSPTCTCIPQWECMVQERPPLLRWRPTISNCGLLLSILLLLLTSIFTSFSSKKHTSKKAKTLTKFRQKETFGRTLPLVNFAKCSETTWKG